jgi:hypothetical protein
MTKNYNDNVIELNCSKLEISDDEHGIQIIFNGENELDYFLVQRTFDDEWICDFYTEGCDTTGWWTFIHVTLKQDYVTISVDKMPIQICLTDIDKKSKKRLRLTLKDMVGLIGKLTDDSGTTKRKKQP